MDEIEKHNLFVIIIADRLNSLTLVTMNIRFKSYFYTTKNAVATIKKLVQDETNGLLSEEQLLDQVKKLFNKRRRINK